MKQIGSWGEALEGFRAVVGRLMKLFLKDRKNLMNLIQQNKKYKDMRWFDLHIQDASEGLMSSLRILLN